MSYNEAGRLGAIVSAEVVVIKKQQRIDEWNQNPKLCLFCNKSLPYNKRQNIFCSRNCAASYNNTKRENLKYCLFCNKILPKKGKRKYCSKKCMSDFLWGKTKEELINSGIDNSAKNKLGKKYLIELHKGKCQICNFSEWQGHPIPLVLDHIDGDPYNDLLSNLRVICNNCDALQPTFKGRNKGKGRFKRAQRYKFEKESLGDFKFKH